MWWWFWTPHIWLVFNSNICPNSAALRDISLWNLSDLDIDLSRSLKVKCDSVIGLPIYGFLFMFNSNIWPNSAPLRYISCQNLSDLDFDFQDHWPWHWPFKVTEAKCNYTNELPIYAFLSIFNSNIWPNSDRLQDIKVRNSSDPDFDLLMSLKVKFDGVIGLSIYAFLLLSLYIITACLSLAI